MQKRRVLPPEIYGWSLQGGDLIGSTPGRSDKRHLVKDVAVWVHRAFHTYFAFMVRPATSFDASAIASLFQETMKRAAFGDDRLKRVSDWAGGGSEVARWRARQTSRATFVYEAGGMVRGFAEIEPNGHLDAFCVHADQQRQGIGSALLAEIEVEARRNGVHHLFTETGASARAFFQKRGFKILKPSERNFPNSGEGNVRMSKTLVATR